MQFRVRSEKGVEIIELFGSLDLSTVEETKRVLADRFVDPPKAVLVDLGGLTFLRTAGFPALFELYEQGRKHNLPIGLLGPQDPVLTILQVFRLDTVIPVYEDVVHALREMDFHGSSIKKPEWNE